MPTTVRITEIKARPDSRFLSNGNNYDVDAYFSILHADNQNHSVLYQHSNLITTDTSGTASPYADLPLPAGTYDAAIKAKAHLRRILDNVHLAVGDNILNFTNAANLPAIGNVVLIPGDINGSGNSLETMGDNVINAVDISALLSQLNQADLNGNSIRANLNQDTVVDGQDLNILISNLDKEGDR